jgi:hypothetical protein
MLSPQVAPPLQKGHLIRLCLLGCLLTQKPRHPQQERFYRKPISLVPKHQCWRQYLRQHPKRLT